MNSRVNLNSVFGTTYTTDDDLRIYMRANKTDCALKILTIRILRREVCSIRSTFWMRSNE